MNNTKQNHSRFGIVLSGALLAAAVFAVPGIFKGQQEAEVVENYYPAIPMQAAPSAPEASSSTGSTTLYIQNKEAVAGSVYVTFYQDSGASIDLTSCLVGTAGVTNTIPASGNLTLDYSGCGALASGSRGSSVVSSDVDVAVASNNSYSSNKATGGVVGWASGANDIQIPQIAREFGGQLQSSFYVQNTESTTRTATIEFYKVGVIGPISTTSVSLPPFSSKIFDLSASEYASAPFGTGFIGSARVFGPSGVGLFAVSFDVRRNAGGLGSTDTTKQFVFSANGPSQSASRFYSPFVKRDFNGGFFTGFQLVNNNSVTVTVGFQFKALGGTPTQSSDLVSIPPNSSITYNQQQQVSGLYISPISSSMSSGWNGSAIITSSLPIYATGRDAKPLPTNGTRPTSAAFALFTDTDGASKVFVPNLRNKVGIAQVSTAVRLQNIGTVTQTIRIDHYTDLGSPSLSPAQMFDEATVGPGETIGFTQFGVFRKDLVTTYPAGYIGHGVIYGVTGPGSTTLDPNAKIIALVNEQSLTTVITDAFDADMYEATK